MELLVEKNALVIPGDLIAKGEKIFPGDGSYRIKTEDSKNEIYAAMIGLVKVSKNRVGVVPLEGCYIPLEGDVIIGKVIKAGITSWNVEIRGPYTAILSVNDVIDRNFDPAKESIEKFLRLGDIVKAQITKFDRTRDPVLTLNGRGLRKLDFGRLIEVDPVKIPRIIGKRGSMIQMLKNVTGAYINVGQNGRVVIKARDLTMENLVIECLRKIESEAHTSGLTDRMRIYLDKRKSEITSMKITNEEDE